MGYTCRYAGRNEVLVYGVAEHIAKMLPIIYTPTFGWRSSGSAMKLGPTRHLPCGGQPRGRRRHDVPKTPVWAPTGTSTSSCNPTPKGSWDGEKGGVRRKD